MVGLGGGGSSPFYFSGGGDERILILAQQSYAPQLDQHNLHGWSSGTTCQHD